MRRFRTAVHPTVQEDVVRKQYAAGREKTFQEGQIMHVLRLGPVQKDEVVPFPQSGQNVRRVARERTHPVRHPELRKMRESALSARRVVFDGREPQIGQFRKERKRRQPLPRADLQRRTRAAHVRGGKEKSECIVGRSGVQPLRARLAERGKAFALPQTVPMMCAHVRCGRCSP